MVTDRLQLLFCPGYVCLFVWKQNLCSVKKMLFVSSIFIFFYLSLFSGFSYRVHAPSSSLAPSLTASRYASQSARAHGDLDTFFIVLHRRLHYKRSHSWLSFDHRQEKSSNKVVKERPRLTLHDVFIFERHTYTVVLSLLFLLMLNMNYIPLTQTKYIEN